MPCYRCGTRQVDPDRGTSLWTRGVLADRQVLICPDCQSAGEWVADLDRCQVCASIRLVRRLGEVECRECGNVGEHAVAASRAMKTAGEMREIGDMGEFGEIARQAAGGVSAPGLAEEVEQALARVLGRPARRHADQLR